MGNKILEFLMGLFAVACGLIVCVLFVFVTGYVGFAISSLIGVDLTDDMLALTWFKHFALGMVTYGALFISGMIIQEIHGIGKSILGREE